MTAPVEIAEKKTRTRASKTAIAAAIKAVQETGLTVHKLCVNGGKVEIHTLPVDDQSDPQSPEGPKQW